MDTALHFPLTGWIGNFFTGLSVGAIENLIVVIAAVKIIISFAWMITIALQPTMGVAWHRFLAFFNIFFKRHADGRTSLGELQPIRVGGEVLDFENVDELDEDAALGVGKVEDFTWKGLLDFTTCTECGRCQSQCPAWNTDKPLSPKLLVMTLRDHAYAKSPWLLASEEVRAGGIDAAEGFTDATKGAVATEQLVGETGYDIRHPLTAYNPHGPDAVIDEDVLWSCTTCGACVEQCPVDIEHVDAIVDMRRYKNLIESAFPAELNGLFKNLEKNSNPWGLAPRLRMDWAKDLPFEVKQVGQDVEDLNEVDYLFWVGCAGAYEDRAKKTTRAVAELLDTAGVSFAVLGDGEACTGDSARRAGNEFLFQMLAQQNVETLNEVGATKIVVTCAHCFNTIKNEYPQLGGQYEVLHHTQLLNRLVREKRLTPVARPGDASSSGTLTGAASTGPRSRTTTPATWVGTTRSTPRRASCSRSCPASSTPRWSARRRSRSAAAPVAPACGWRRSSARGSTTTAPRRLWRRAPSASPSAAPSARSCSPTASTPRSRTARPPTPSRSSTSRRCSSRPSAAVTTATPRRRRPSPSRTRSPPRSAEPAGRHTPAPARRPLPLGGGGLRAYAGCCAACPRAVPATNS